MPTTSQVVFLHAARRGEIVRLPRRAQLVFADGCARVERDAEPSYLVDPNTLLTDDGLEPLALRPATAEGARILTLPLAAGMPARVVAPCGADLYLAAWRLRRALECRADERGLVDEVQERAARALPQGRAARPAALVVEDAKLLLAREYRGKMSLSDVALSVESSPFHLCRLFRRETGWSIHGFRDQLRLRRALDLCSVARGSIADVALALGYAGHSHFTLAFRRAFGVPPSRASATQDRDSSGERASR